MKFHSDVFFLFRKQYETDIEKFFSLNLRNKSYYRVFVNFIPEEWLQWNDADESPEEIREIYFNFLKTRLENSEIFLNEAKNARG